MKAEEALTKIAEKIEAAAAYHGHDDMDAETAYGAALWAVHQAIRETLEELRRAGS
jgi:hypothetical protein